jgi:hypothetical protein
MKRDMDLCRKILSTIEKEHVDTVMCNITYRRIFYGGGCLSLPNTA